MKKTVKITVELPGDGTSASMLVHDDMFLDGPQIAFVVRELFERLTGDEVIPRVGVS